jgi:hypothetical protein
MISYSNTINPKPFNYLIIGFEKYELPRRIKKGKEISSKLSESAFGSSKYNNSNYLINRSD